MLFSTILLGCRSVCSSVLDTLPELPQLMIPRTTRAILSSLTNRLLPSRWHSSSEGCIETKTTSELLMRWESRADQDPTVPPKSNASDFDETSIIRQSLTEPPVKSDLSTVETYSQMQPQSRSFRCEFTKRAVTDDEVTRNSACEDRINLDWCRWPVCMAFYLEGTCPFGESACPDAHASSSFASVINNKGLVRVCFDALGVGGRICHRKPGFCRFFHAPAHIRYQLMEFRYGNRSDYQIRMPKNRPEVEISQIPVRQLDERASLSATASELAVLVAVVARLLEAEVNRFSEGAELVLAALAGNPGALHALRSAIQQQQSSHATSAEQLLGLQSSLNTYLYQE